MSLPFNIRWMISADLPEVLRIERASYESPWTRDEFLHTVWNKTVIGCVAEVDEGIIGYMLYEICATRLILLNLAVAPQFRRMGVGKGLLARLLQKARAKKLPQIHAELGEDNLGGQLFMRAMGYWCFSTQRGECEDGSDLYLFRYELQPEVSEVVV